MAFASIFSLLLLLLAAGCTDDCLRHSDCPLEQRCRSGRCVFEIGGDADVGVSDARAGELGPDAIAARESGADAGADMDADVDADGATDAPSDAASDASDASPDASDASPDALDASSADSD
ncbi:MAG: hypothetical protein KC503_29325 [Myxococcales bacterium]|nr:hypothetical protein [Myxococcales bacterium]